MAIGFHWSLKGYDIMVRIFVKQKLHLGALVNCNAEMQHHLKHVMRKRCGDVITVIDGLKKEYLGRIVTINNDDLVVEIQEHCAIQREPSLSVTLYQGLPKKDKMELIITKGTEIGANRFVPVQMTRSVVKAYGEKNDKRQARWDRIALAAARQAHRQHIPVISPVHTFKQMLQELSSYDLILVPYEDAQKKDLSMLALDQSIRQVALIIGPEGGMTHEEIEQLKLCAAHIVTLGPRILRTETAGFVALTVLLFRSGDLGGY